jgi:hypothetical protein
MEINKVIENLVGMEITEDFENDIICAFGDYEFDGITEIIVSESNVGYQAYANHEDAPIIMIEVQGNKVIKVWED